VRPLIGEIVLFHGSDDANDREVLSFGYIGVDAGKHHPLVERAALRPMAMGELLIDYTHFSPQLNVVVSDHAAFAQRYAQRRKIVAGNPMTE
jgi:hypothetical protein